MSLNKNRTYSHFKNYRGEIVIEENNEDHQDEENTDNQKPINHHSDQGNIQDIQRKAIESIKINQQKIQKYALKQKVPKNGEDISNRYQKHFHIRHPQKSHLNNNTMIHSNSMATLKKISHKIVKNNIKSNIRMKTEVDKQNQLNQFLPKMVRQRSNINHKQTSAIVLKKTFQKHKQTVKEVNKIHQNINDEDSQNQSIVQYKIQTKTNLENQQEETKSFHKTYSLGKIKSLSQLSLSHNQTFNDSSGDVQFLLVQINKRQQNFGQQKMTLQRRILNLKEAIQSERVFLHQIDKNTKKMSLQISKIQHTGKCLSSGSKLSKRKNQNVQNEAKQIQSNLAQYCMSNNKLCREIQQETQLIAMYQSVINQIKSQLKLEQQQKSELAKKLIILKKVEQTVKSKCTVRQQNNGQLIRNIHHSLQKWK